MCKNCDDYMREAISLSVKNIDFLYLSKFLIFEQIIIKDSASQPLLFVQTITTDF